MNFLDKHSQTVHLRGKDQFDVPPTLMIFQTLDSPSILSFASILPSYLHAPLGKQPGKKLIIYK